jgi:hypothetical protein
LGIIFDDNRNITTYFTLADEYREFYPIPATRCLAPVGPTLKSQEEPTHFSSSILLSVESSQTAWGKNVSVGSDPQLILLKL